MYDTHFDLLTILYCLKDNKDYLNKIIDCVSRNMVGLNANLYFMSEQEMKSELKIEGDIDVVKMFKEAVLLLKEYDLDKKIIYSIEGCDYIRNSLELEDLYYLGLRAILPVWNNENRYGSGIRSNKGLTREGKKLIEKAIDLGIAIDLSHANKKTFYGIIDTIRNSKKKVICYASHSNVYDICNNPRNLDINQLKALRTVGGYLGLVTYPPFICLSSDREIIENNFLDHIVFAVSIMGIDHVMIASDNMEFYKILNISYVDSPFNLSSLKDYIYSLLKRKFRDYEIRKIMYENALKIYDELCFNS